MLHPPGPSKVTWVEQPGNPNFLIPIGVTTDNDNNTPTKKREIDLTTKESDSEEEEEEMVSVKREKLEDNTFHHQEELIGGLLREALAPLYRFVGMLEAESGQTIYYQYSKGKTMEEKMTPLKTGSKNREEFRRWNNHLGDVILDRLLPLEKETLVGNPVRDAIWENLTGEQINTDYLPDWIWTFIEEPVFRFILSSSTFGAMQLAASELNFPLKSLIESNSVNYMFAQFVARKFISPKTNAFPSGISGGQTQYRISSGFNTSQMAHSKWLMGCKLWFKNVIWVDNRQLSDAQKDYDRLSNLLQRKRAEYQVAHDDLLDMAEIPAGRLRPLWNRLRIIVNPPTFQIKLRRALELETEMEVLEKQEFDARIRVGRIAESFSPKVLVKINN